MDACELQATGNGFKSKLNRLSQQINVTALGGVLTHSVKGGKSREFKIGEHARIVRGLFSGEEVDVDSIEDLDDLSHGEILSFWTCIDGKDAHAAGAEVKVGTHKMRLPLRILLPMANPTQRDE